MQPINSPKCPKCSGEMVLRNGKYSQFWGCKSFPKCRGTRSYSENGSQVKRELKSIDKPNPRQDTIFRVVEEIVKTGEYQGHKHLIVNAGPGTGKTTTEEHITLQIKKLDPDASIVYLVFNKHVEREAVSKGLPARTTHSFYYEQYRNWRAGKKVKVDDNKVRNIVKSLVQNTWDEDKYLISPICQLVNKVKNTCAPTDNANLDKLCSRFNIEVNGSADRVFGLVRYTIVENNKQLDVIDLDDMLYMTWKLKVPIQAHKYVLGDEGQDFNQVQIELIKRTVSKDGMVLIVGDNFQSIYGFRGATLDAMPQMEKFFNAASLPLDITYRCPKSHVELLNDVFPERPLFAHSEAKEGQLLSISEDKMLGMVRDGDLILSRTNAPLVKPVFSLIRRGVKAIIRGRDIGQNLISLVEKFEDKSTQIDVFLSHLIAYENTEVAKLMKAEKNSQAESLQDKVETIIAISDGCRSTYQIKTKIQEVFSDKKEGVVFSTVHKAKGDEASNVFILKPELMPHPMSQAKWEIAQEKNVLWVALSRSKDKMYFVGGPAPAPIWDELDEEESEGYTINIGDVIFEGEPTPEEIKKVYKAVEDDFTHDKHYQKRLEKKEKWKAPEIPKVPF